MSRRLFLAVHQWIGLAGGAFLIVIATTGSALVFENEIDRALNPSLSFVTPGARPLPPETMVAAAMSAYPQDQVVGMRIADKPDQARPQPASTCRPARGPCFAF